MKSDQLSKTAAFIAIKFYGLTLGPTFHSLFDQSVIKFYDRIVQHLPFPLNKYHYWLKFDWVRRLYTWSEELLLPGDLLHIIARKYYIRQQVDKLQDDGYEQIIVFGAGFDDLAYTYAQKGSNCFELDVPHMAKYKQQFLDTYYPDSKHPEIIQSHLTKDQQSLPFASHSNIDPDKKTIIIAEGFFDYLPKNLVEDILSQLQYYFTDRPALITTHFALDELPPHHRWSFKSGVKAVSEELKLHLDISAYRKLITDNAFTIEKQLDHRFMASELQLKTGTDLPLLKGFYILKCK